MYHHLFTHFKHLLNIYYASNSMSRTGIQDKKTQILSTKRLPRGREKASIRIWKEESQQRYYDSTKEGHLHQTRTEAGGSWTLSETLLIEGGARAPETGIREHNSMGLPSEDPMAWPGMAPKESNVPTNVPGHPRGLYRGTLGVDWPVSLDNGFPRVSPPNTIIFFMYFDRKKKKSLVDW